MTSRRLLIANLMAGAILLAATVVRGEVLYVDNVAGNDASNGKTREVGAGTEGPFRTIQRALAVYERGDSISLVNTGAPYYESIALAGPRFSGTAQLPVVIDGGGSVLSGACLVPTVAWQYVGNDVWRFRPFRKGWYQLLRDEAPLPEVRVAPEAKVLPELTAGQWAAWQGLIWYRAKIGDGESPLDLPLAFAHKQVGISLYKVEHVVIRDLTIRHFRQDGVNAHDGVHSVILDKVNLLENGRAGISVSGVSLVGIRDSKIAGNRDVQLLNAEVAQTEIERTDFGELPRPFRLRGGHVFVDGQEVTGE